MNKGTLTVFSGTNAILGLPTEPIYPNAKIAEFTATVQEWLEHGGVIYLPFPVEVIDLRQQKQEITIGNVGDPASAKLVFDAMTEYSGRKIIRPIVPEEKPAFEPSGSNNTNRNYD
jgi:hypothetical protein